MILGTCIWCGHALCFTEPGSPPGDCLVGDLGDFYHRSDTWRDFTLIDTPLVYGKVCPLAQGQPGQAVGQFGIHEVRA
jgi:hypothetical protein